MRDLVLIGAFASFALPLIWSVQALVVHADSAPYTPCDYTICYDGECWRPLVCRPFEPSLGEQHVASLHQQAVPE